MGEEWTRGPPPSVDPHSLATGKRPEMGAYTRRASRDPAGPLPVDQEEHGADPADRPHSHRGSATLDQVCRYALGALGCEYAARPVLLLRRRSSSCLRGPNGHDRARLRWRSSTEGCDSGDSSGQVALVEHEIAVQHRTTLPAPEPHRHLVGNPSLNESACRDSATVIVVVVRRVREVTVLTA